MVTAFNRIACTLLICFYFVNTAQTRALRIFTKEDDTSSEDVDDIYDGEEHRPVYEKDSDSGIVKDVPSTTVAATTQKATTGIFSEEDTTTSTAIPPNYPEIPFNWPFQPELTKQAHQNTQSNQVQTIVISLPNGVNGAAGQTIEIKIPTETVRKYQESKFPNGVPQMSVPLTDEQRVKNIEAALTDVLHGFGGEVQISQVGSNGETEKVTQATASVGEVEETQSVIVTDRAPSQSSSSFNAPSLTEMLLEQIRNGQLPSLIVKGLKYATENAERIEDAFLEFECVVFRICRRRR